MAALALAAVLVTDRAGAQTHVVKKPETVVRAIGVYEWTGDESKPDASRFVPVSLFIDAQFEDAGVYLARPVPFALATGTIFELDHAGVPEGELDIAFARHLVSSGGAQEENTWLGYGLFKPETKPKVSTLRASKSTPQIVVSGGKPAASSVNSGTGPTFSKPASSTDDSSQPTLHRKNSDDSTASTASSTPAPAATQTASTNKTTDADDPDRPVLIRRPGSEDTASTPAATTATGTQTADASAKPGATSSATPTVDPNDAADRPTLKKRSEPERQASRRSQSTASVTAGSTLNDDPDRPTIHRGGETGFNPDSIKPLEGTPAAMQQRVAVSDAANRPVHDFHRAWVGDSERTDVLAKMQAMARAKLAGYDGITGKQIAAAPTAAPKPAATRTAAARRKTPPPPAPAELTDEHLAGYTLSFGGDATYVYTATSTGANGTPRYVTVVAQQAPVASGNPELKLAMASVTDAAHLDRTPWMRLVDAVDAEASNRASLLFELRAEHTRQFALYRVIGAEAQQTFVTGTTE